MVKKGDTFELYPSIGKLILLSSITSILIIIFAYVIFNLLFLNSEKSIPAILLSSTFFVFLLFIALLLIKTFIRKKPLLIISPQGITIQKFSLRPQSCSWNEVGTITVRHGRGASIIITKKDSSQISIPKEVLSGDLETLAQFLESYKK